MFALSFVSEATLNEKHTKDVNFSPHFLNEAMCAIHKRTMNNVIQQAQTVLLRECENSLIRFVNLNNGRNETNSHIPNYVFVAGTIGKILILKTRRGDMATVALTGGNTKVEVFIFSEIFAAYQSLIHEGRILGVKGRVSIDERSNNLRISADELYDAEQDRVKVLEYLEV